MDAKEKYKDMLMEKVDGGYNEEYSRFKESIVGGTDFPYEETADKDYNAEEDDVGNVAFRDLSDDDVSYSEFDESFIEDDEDEEEEEEDDYTESEYYDDEEEDRKYNVITKLVMLFCGIVMFYLSVSYLLTSATPGNDLSMAGSSLQKQINHLYSELNTREQKHVKELDKTVKVVISQFEKNIKRILPKNIKNLQSQIESLNEKVNGILGSNNKKLTVENITGWQEQLLAQLNKSLPTEVPVVVNNSSTMLIIPEMHQYISEILSQIVHTSEPFFGNSSTLGYDLNDYIKEILTNELQYVDKEYFIQELNRHLQLNKHEILQEVLSKIQETNTRNTGKSSSDGLIPDQYRTIILKKMVHDIYNSNQYRWEDDLDFSTASQGARLVKHLTSSTYNYKNGNVVTPLELLTDSSISRGSTYWQCVKPIDCSWTIRFNEPIYLTRLSYLHGRFTNNLHMMTSAPKLISVYVKLANNNVPGMDKKLREASKTNGNSNIAFSQDTSYVLVSTYKYDLMDKRVRQNFPLPSWFIQLKPLVRSIAFVVNENYGNKEYTSLRKFIINGVTMTDLTIIENNEYPIMKDFIPDYSEQHDSTTGNLHKLAAKDQRVPSFGHDELDI